MTSTASISSRIIPVVFVSAYNYLVVEVAGWDDVDSIRRKVLVFDGRNYAFTGWNSDRNEAYFKPATSVAFVR